MAKYLDYARFVSRAAARRQPSAIREASKYKKHCFSGIQFSFLLAQLFQRSPPSTISFASGSPNPSLFPFKEAAVTLL